MNRRWKNYGLWLAVLAFIAMLCDSLGLKLLPEDYDSLCKTFLGVLVLAGILNDPTSQNPGYQDDLY